MQNSKKFYCSLIIAFIINLYFTTSTIAHNEEINFLESILNNYTDELTFKHQEATKAMQILKERYAIIENTDICLIKILKLNNSCKERPQEKNKLLNHFIKECPDCLEFLKQMQTEQMRQIQIQEEKNKSPFKRLNEKLFQQKNSR